MSSFPLLFFQASRSYTSSEFAPSPVVLTRVKSSVPKSMKSWPPAPLIKHPKNPVPSVLLQLLLVHASILFQSLWCVIFLIRQSSPQVTTCEISCQMQLNTATRFNPSYHSLSATRNGSNYGGGLSARGKCYLLLGVISHFCSPWGSKDIYRAKIWASIPCFKASGFPSQGPSCTASLPRLSIQISLELCNCQIPYLFFHCRE